MYKIEWKKSFNTDVKIIDEQHYNFISLINDLFFTSGKNTSAEYIQKAEIIYQDILTHFATEEKLMKDSRYEGFFSHKAEHERFVKSFLKRFSELESTGYNNHDYFLQSIEKWFINHLEINDRKLTDYLISTNNSNAQKK